MRKSIFVVVLSVLTCGSLSWSQGHHPGGTKVDAEHSAGGEDVMLKGELLDMACYMAHEGKGKKHAKCAKMCVLGGAPLGILTKDGKVYLLVENHSSAKAKKPYAQAKEFIAETVTITGTAYERGGVQAIVIESVSKE